MAPAFDTSWVRSQFPALNRDSGAPPEIYFDGPGGTQVPQRVIDAVSHYLAGANANLHGAFRASRETDFVVEEAHRAAADLLGCSEREVVFGPNMTTLAFWLSRALACELAPGDEILVTRLDHDANHAPWMSLREHGIGVREVPFHREDCTLDLDDLRSKLNSRTKLVAVGYASNAVGTVNDIERIARDAHGVIDVKAIDCDFLTCSAYKFFGPHQGLLYGKQEHLERLRAFKVRPADDGLPWRFETGTQNHECMAGTTAAIEYLAELGRRCSGGAATVGRRAGVVSAMRAIKAYERRLAVRLIRGLLRLPGLEFYGIRDEARFDERAPTAAIRLRGFSPRQVAVSLGERGICVWDGNFYALNVTDDLGVEDSGGLVRIGLAHYNTAGEVDRLLAALERLVSRGTAR
jgi:cysteine desulfurase family protein (TIGR01976 family)